MDAGRRSLGIVVALAALLAFHLWLLYRMVVGGSWALAALLLVAVGLFAWRLAPYASRYRAAAPPSPRKEGAQELRQMRVLVPVLAGLLALHAWLLPVVLAAGDVLFGAVLALAVLVFAARLALYARRYRQIRARGSALEGEADLAPEADPRDPSGL